jgi:hypothetical protein
VRLGRRLYVLDQTIIFMHSIERLNKFGTRYCERDDDIKDLILDFAIVKLLKMREWKSINPNNQYHQEELAACLLCRLCLNFNFESPDGKRRGMEHVESHMRICMDAKSSFESMHIISPSEPVLTLGAILVMKAVPINSASVLTKEFQRPDIERRPRGDAAMKLLLTLALDETAPADKPGPWDIVSFMQELFGSPSSDVCDVLDALPSCVHSNTQVTFKTRFRETFKDCKMNINHFVNCKFSGLLNRRYLWALIIRCAGAEPPVDHGRANLVIPFVYYDEPVARWSVSAIIARVLDDEYGSNPDPHATIFDDMDPYRLGMFFYLRLRLLYRMRSNHSNRHRAGFSIKRCQLFLC